MAGGEPNQALWDVIALNVRTPEKVMGDLQAQLAACRSGEREMLELFERYGVDTVLDYGTHLQDYAERLTRAEIAEFPDGVYEFTDHIEGLGEEPELVVVKTTVTVAGEDVSIDFAGTSDQIRGGINPTFPFTKASCYAALRSVMVSDIPNCHGFTVPITVTAPKGSLVNPLFPSPCGARGITGYRIIDCLFGALAQALPDRVTADTAGGSTLPTIAGYENGKAFVFCETFMGTWGGTSGHDGQQGVPHMGANQSNVSVEMIESEYPIRINEYGMIADTGGAGRHRGGLGLVREYEILSDEAILNVRSDKRRFPPHGLFGGRPGSASWNYVNPGRSDRVLPVLMTEVEKLRRGDVFRHEMSGGGGFGDPLDRDPERVLRDVVEEKVTPEHAEREYGVVLVEPESDGVRAIDASAPSAFECGCALPPRTERGAGGRGPGGAVQESRRTAYREADSLASSLATAIQAPATPRSPPAAIAATTLHGCRPTRSKSLAYNATRRSTGPSARPIAAATRTHATPPAVTPCQNPVYRNGRRIKASVAPNSLMTPISSRRLSIPSRMVFPTMSRIPSPSIANSTCTIRRSASMIAANRSTHIRSS